MRVGINLEQLLFRTPGGVGRYTARLATLLPGLFPDDEYGGFIALHRRRPPLPLEASVLPLPRPVLYDAWHLLGRPRVRGFDLLHAPSVAVPPKGHGALVVTVHDAAPLLFPETFTARGRRFHRQGLAAAAARADLVIAVSQSAADEVTAHTAIDPRRVRVVHNGVDQVMVTERMVTEVRRRHHLDDRPYVFWLGTQEPRKNVRLLVQSFAGAVARTGSPHALVLAGGAGWLHQDALSMPGAAALGDRLRVLGAVPDADLHPQYKGADLFAFPSLHEGFGLPSLEALAQGTPVICTDGSSLPEVTAGAAHLVPPDVEAWSDALSALLSDPDHRTAHVDKGIARAAELTWEACARRTHEVYSEALGL